MSELSWPERITRVVAALLGIMGAIIFLVAAFGLVGNIFWQLLPGYATALALTLGGGALLMWGSELGGEELEYHFRRRRTGLTRLDEEEQELQEGEQS